MWRSRGRNTRIPSILLGMALFAAVFFFVTFHEQEPLKEFEESVPEKSQRLAAYTRITSRSSRCSPEKHNLVYIKMMKCASETLTSIIRRFGYLRKLSFVLPPGNRIYLGWPYDIQEGFHRPAKSTEFNIACEHSVFKEEVFENLMPRDTVYVTSIREPYSQFKSMFNYYKLAQISNLTTKYNQDPISEYLNNIEKYEAIYKSPAAAKTRYCVPDGLSMSKNLMSYNLGFPLGFPEGMMDLSNSDKEISEWLNFIEIKFSLVIVVEYFDESLILLKRLMCWSLKDILYQNRNVKKYHYKDNINNENQLLYKNWSRVDHRLYDHFLKVFWRKIEKEGKDFMNEVEHFKEVRAKVIHFCESAEVGQGIVIDPSGWNPTFIVTTEHCELMKIGLLQKLKQQYDDNPVIAPTALPKINFC